MSIKKRHVSEAAFDQRLPFVDGRLRPEADVQLGRSGPELSEENLNKLRGPWLCYEICNEFQFYKARFCSFVARKLLYQLKCLEGKILDFKDMADFASGENDSLKLFSRL